jgi:DNA-binding MarR family transcriptional regulator
LEQRRPPPERPHIHRGNSISEPLDEKVRQSAAILGQLVQKVDDFRRRLAVGAGISVGELRVLGRIAESDEVTPTAIADLLGLTTGSVTALVDRLETAGLVTRRSNPADRRSRYLVLTDKGQELVRTTGEEFYERIRVVLARMPAEHVLHVDQFLTLLAEEVNGYLLAEPAVDR